MTIDMEEEVNTMCNISDWIVECATAEAEERAQERHQAELAATETRYQKQLADTEVKYKEEIAAKDAALVSKDNEIAQLKAALAASAR